MAEVLNIHSNKANDPEFQNLRNAFYCVDPEIKFKLIQKSVGINDKSKLNSHTQVVSDLSLAARMGHETIKSFIECRSTGIGIEWSEWDRMVRANYIRETYHVFSSSDEQIIAEFEDIVTYLKREPFDEREYHDSKNAIFHKLKDSITSRFEFEVNNLKSDKDKLEIALESKTSEFNNLVSKHEFEKSTLNDKLNAVMSDWASEKVSLKSLHEKELNKISEEKLIALNVQEREINQKFSEEIGELNKEISTLNHLLSSANNHHQQEISRLSEEHSNILKLESANHQSQLEEVEKIYSENHVRKENYNAILIELDEQRTKSLDLMANELRLTEKIETFESGKIELENTLQDYKAKIADLNNKILNGEIEATDINASEIKNEYDLILNKYNALLEIAEKQKSIIHHQKIKVKKSSKKIAMLTKQLLKAKSYMKTINKEKNSYLAAFIMTTVIGLTIMGLSILKSFT